MKTFYIKQTKFYRLLKLLLVENGNAVLTSSIYQADKQPQVSSADEERNGRAERPAETKFRTRAHTGNYLAGANGIVNPELFK